MRGGPHQRRKRRHWHRKPRNKTYARHIGTQTEIERTEKEIRRLELLVAEGDRKRDAALDRERYHDLRLKTICNI